MHCFYHMAIKIYGPDQCNINKHIKEDDNVSVGIELVEFPLLIHTGEINLVPA